MKEGFGDKLKAKEEKEEKKKNRIDNKSENNEGLANNTEAADETTRVTQNPGMGRVTGMLK